MKLLLLSILLLSSCVSIQKLDPEIYYRNDICFEYKTGKVIKKRKQVFGRGFGRPYYINETMRFCGTAVLPHRDEYDLKITSYGALNFFSLMTCHEEDTSENPDKGIFKKNGVIYVKYKPTLEKDMACPLYINAYNKKRKHAWGILVFEHPRFQLKANIRCNGYEAEANGVSVCQSRNGLVQEIKFEEEVKVVKPVVGGVERHGECPGVTSKDGKTFRLKLPPRECIYQFIGKQSKKIHRFYSVGYEEIIIRE